VPLPVVLVANQKMAILLQGLVIKDLTTGQMYGLDKTSPDACGGSTTHLTDIASGRKITLDEFSGVLGHDSTFTSKVRFHASLLCSNDVTSSSWKVVFKLLLLTDLSNQYFSLCLSLPCLQLLLSA